MTESFPGGAGLLMMPMHQQVDEICDRFERTWKAGERPRIEDHLSDTAQEERPTLLRELLRLEVYYRLQSGEEPTLREYRARFPEATGVIDSVFSESLGLGAKPQVTGPDRGAFAPPEHIIGSTFGRYRVMRRLGEGGMGSVYLAYDPQLDRRVALKIPRVLAGDTSILLERFHREARAAARIRHPNICAVHDVGRVGEVPYVTMEYIEGLPLSSLINRDAPMSQRQAAAIALTLASAMEQAHRYGVIHRDLKPANVLINPHRQPVIVDFGLAKRAAEDFTLTVDGQVLGTPYYMSPELARGAGRQVDGRTDIYSLGVILYELLTGRRPFEGPELTAILCQLISEDPLPPSAYRTDLDPRLETICQRAMAREPESRFGTMGELAQALRGYLRDTHRGTEPGQGGEDAEQTELVGQDFSRIDLRPEPVPTVTLRSLPDLGGVRKPPRRLVPAAAGATALALLGVILIVATDTGTVTIDLKDPNIVVHVDGRVIRIEQLDEPLKLRAGDHELVLTRGQLEAETRSFHVVRGGHEVLRVEFTPKAPPPPPTAVASSEPARPAPRKAPDGAPPRTPPSKPAEMVTNSIGMKLVLIPAGEFLMGSVDGDDAAQPAEKPQHRVRVTRPFYLGACEVTQDDYQQVMGANPSLFQGSGRRPVEMVTWFDAVEFCNRLSAKEGLRPYYGIEDSGRLTDQCHPFCSSRPVLDVTILGDDGYRLATEAEWEYGCRAGTTTRAFFGDLYSASARLKRYAWFMEDEKNGMPHEVGRKEPNAFGLYDTFGNVSEWCWDCYGEAFYRQSPVADPVGPITVGRRVLRGGSCFNGSFRSAHRVPCGPQHRNIDIGFRVARTQK